MAEIKRRDLLVGAGALAAAGGAAVATTASDGAARNPLELDVSKGTPVLPEDKLAYHFPLASAKPSATTPGGTVTELTEDNFPIFKGNAAGVFFLVLKPARCANHTGIQTPGRWTTARRDWASSASSRRMGTSAFRRFPQATSASSRKAGHTTFAIRDPAS